jgi:hypothetical protein
VQDHHSVPANRLPTVTRARDQFSDRALLHPRLLAKYRVGAPNADGVERALVSPGAHPARRLRTAPGIWNGSFRA